MTNKCKTFKVAWFYRAVVIFALSFSLWYNFQQHEMLVDCHEFTLEVHDEAVKMYKYKKGWIIFTDSLGFSQSQAEAILDYIDANEPDPDK